LTAVVDLPTPPLQEDTAMMCFTCASPPGRVLSAVTGLAAWAVIFTATLRTHGSSCKQGGKEGKGAGGRMVGPSGGGCIHPLAVGA
jgi:hypothetical protein